MSIRRSVSISLSREFHAVVERMLTTGRYSNFSEVVHAGLRLLDEREQNYREHKFSRSVDSPVSTFQGLPEV